MAQVRRSKHAMRSHHKKKRILLLGHPMQHLQETRGACDDARRHSIAKSSKGTLPRYPKRWKYMYKREGRVLRPCTRRVPVHVDVGRRIVPTLLRLQGTRFRILQQASGLPEPRSPLRSMGQMPPACGALLAVRFS